MFKRIDAPYEQPCAATPFTLFLVNGTLELSAWSTLSHLTTDSHLQPHRINQLEPQVVHLHPKSPSRIKYKQFGRSFCSFIIAIRVQLDWGVVEHILMCEIA